MKNPCAEEFNGPDIVLHRTKPGPLVATPQTVGQIFRQTFRKDDKHTLRIFFYLLSSITGASEQSMFVILDLYLIQWLIFRVHTTLAVYFLSGSTYFYFVNMDGSYFLSMHHNDKLHYYNAALWFLCGCSLSCSFFRYLLHW